MEYKRVDGIRDTKTKQMEEYALLEKLKKKELLRWEIKLWYFPLLKNLLDIGAICRLDEELDNLKDNYENCFKWKQLKAFVLFNKHNYQEMIDLLRDVVNDKRIIRVERAVMINNLFCAFRNVNDKAGMDDCIKRLEQEIFEGKLYLLEVLDNVLYYYEEHHNDDKLKKVYAIINSKKEENLQNFFDYGNIIYMYNRRMGKTDDNKKILDELYKAVANSDIEKERQVHIGLKLLRLTFENDYMWKNISLLVYKHADVYLNYSREIALTFMEEVYHLLKNVQELREVFLPDEQAKTLFNKIFRGVGKYMPEIDSDLATLPDDFLYVKKELLMHKVTYARIKVSIDGNSELYEREITSLEKRIVSLCKRNGDEREMLHFMVVLADDTIDVIKKGSSEIWSDEVTK